MCESAIFNCLQFLVDDSDVQNFILNYDPADAPVPPGDEYGLVGNNSSFSPSAEIRGTTPNKKEQVTLNTNFYELSLQDTCTLEMIGGSIGVLTTEGGANWTGNGVHIVDDVAIAPGPGKVRMFGGHYMGTLTDPSEKLVRKLGN